MADLTQGPDGHYGIQLRGDLFHWPRAQDREIVARDGSRLQTGYRPGRICELAHRTQGIGQVVVPLRQDFFGDASYATSVRAAACAWASSSRTTPALAGDWRKSD